MCSIAGVFGIWPETGAAVRAMLAATSWRGPDATGVFDDGDVVLGHNRLAIQDLADDANQPMLSADGGLAIVFNGEIYNWPELRARYAGRYPFRTKRSDTEVLLAGYSVEGAPFIDRLEGMFAFALYDRRARKAMLARDRIGEKPLYYIECSRQGARAIAFASEAHALHVAGFLDAEPNAEAIYHYLTLLTPPPGETLFAGVRKLPAAARLEIDLQPDDAGPSVTSHDYWSAADMLNRHDPAPFAEIATRGEALLSESIVRQSGSDTPLAVALSGGLDSSLNLHFAQQSRRERRAGGSSELFAINARRLGADPDMDESVIARRLAGDYATPMVPSDLDDAGFWRAFEDCSAAQRDTPVVSTGALLLHLMAERLRDSGIKVMLSGEGGDELGAYKSYFAALDQFAAFQSDAPGARERLSHFTHEGRLVSPRHVMGFNDQDKELHWRGPTPDRNSLAVIADISADTDVDGAEGFARSILLLEYRLRLPEILFPRLDYATMRASVEARAPFVSHPLLEGLLGTAFYERNRGGVPKAWMKAMGARRLPGYVMQQPKLGFGQEFLTVLNADLVARFKAALVEDEAAPLREYVDPAFFEICLTRHQRRGVYGPRLWILYSLNRWLKGFAAEQGDA